MPPHEPGDPGAGYGDDESDTCPEGFLPPLHPDDRLWRHPAEVAAGIGSPRAAVRRQIDSKWFHSGRSVWAVALVAGLIGATMSLGVAAAMGAFDSDAMVGDAALRPLTSSPVASTSKQAFQTATSDGVSDVAELAWPSLARLETPRGVGAAVSVRTDGYLVTTAQLVPDDGTDITVTLTDGTTRPATVIGVDPLSDVAVLHVDGRALSAAIIGSSEDLQVGALAVAVGVSPDGPLSVSVTTGVVSAKGRRLAHADGTVLHDMLLVDSASIRGAAGGAVVDRTGAVIGITTGLPIDSSDGRLTAAIPIELAMHVASQFMEHGAVAHVWIGIEGADAGADVRSTFAPAGGAEVRGVIDGGPAALAGLRAGDVVLAIDDRRVTSMSALIAALRLRSPGESVLLTIDRAGSGIDISVVLAQRPDNA